MIEKISVLLDSVFPHELPIHLVDSASSFCFVKLVVSPRIIVADVAPMVCIRRVLQVVCSVHGLAHDGDDALLAVQLLAKRAIISILEGFPTHHVFAVVARCSRKQHVRTVVRVA